MKKLNNLLKNNLATACYILLSITFFPFAAEASSLVLDDVTITAIQDMQLRKEKRTYFMDVVCVVQNSGKNVLKLKEAKFDLGFALENAEDISIGPVFKNEVLLADKTNSPSVIQLVTNLGDDIQKLHMAMISSEEISSLIMDPKPKLNFHIKGDFGLGIGLKQGWIYLQGVTIDWTLNVDIPRDVFVRTYKTIERVANGGSINDSDSDNLFGEEDEFFEGHDKQ
jgi:hypothetical protein